MNEEKKKKIKYEISETKKTLPPPPERDTREYNIPLIHFFLEYIFRPLAKSLPHTLSLSL